MANINNYFKSKEVSLLKEYDIKANELNALTDEYMCGKYPVISFEYEYKHNDGSTEMYTLASLFEDYEAQKSIDPVEYYGDSFLNSDFMNLGKDEEAIYDGNNHILYNSIEIDLIKRISALNHLIDALESGDKEYIRTLRYADGTKETFINTWK